MLVDIIENSFIDNSVAEHVTALLLLWVGQKMSIFWRQGKSSQGVGCCYLCSGPSGHFPHLYAWGSGAWFRGARSSSKRRRLVRPRHAVCSVVESARFFFTVRLFASYHARNACNYSAQSLTKLKPISFIPVTESNQTLILVLKMCWKVSSKCPLL